MITRKSRSSFSSRARIALLDCAAWLLCSRSAVFQRCFQLLEARRLRMLGDLALALQLARLAPVFQQRPTTAE